MKKILVMVLVAILGVSTAAAQEIYLTGTIGNEIWVANRDGSGSPTLLHSDAAPSPAGPTAIIAVLDHIGQVVYSGGNHGEIDVAPVDGTGTPSVLWDDPACCEHLGVTLDPTTEILYWTTSGGSSIRSGNLDGAGAITDIYTELIEQPVGITLDAASGTLYWASVAYSRIVSGNVDGTMGPTILYDDSDGVNEPRQIVYSNGMLYWTQHDRFPGTGSVVSAPADGNGTPTVLHVVPAPYLPWGIDLNGDTLYWTEFERGVNSQPFNDRIMTGASDGSGSPSVLFAGSYGSLRGVAAGNNIYGSSGGPSAQAIPVLAPWGVASLVVLMLVSSLALLRRTTLD